MLADRNDASVGEVIPESLRFEGASKSSVITQRSQKNNIFSYLDFLTIQKNPKSGTTGPQIVFDNCVSYFGNVPQKTVGVSDRF